MSLLAILSDDIETAMKAKDKGALVVLRMLKTATQNDRVKTGRELNEEEELTVLSRKMKQGKDSLSKSEETGCDDLVEKVKVEITVVERCMPQQLTEEEIRQLVQEIVTQTGATSPKDFGEMMGAMMSKVKDKADDNQVSATVKELL